MAGWSSYQLHYNATYELKMRRMKKVMVAHEAERYAWEVKGSAERDAHEADLAAQDAELAEVVARCCMLRAQTANAEHELCLLRRTRGRVQEDVLAAKLAGTGGRRGGQTSRTGGRRVRTGVCSGGMAGRTGSTGRRN